MGLRNFIRHLVAGRELAALERYRDATHAAWCNLTTVPNASAVAEWIAGHGEGQLDTPLAELRDELTGPGGTKVSAEWLKAAQRELAGRLAWPPIDNT